MKYYIYEGSPESRDETYRFATKREAIRYMKNKIALQNQLGLDWVASVMLTQGCVYVETDATTHYYDRMDQITRELVVARKAASVEKVAGSDLQVTYNVNPPALEPVVGKTIEDIKDLSLEQVSDGYRNGTISEALTEEYIELWNRGPHSTKAQLTDGVIRNYIAPEPVHEITKASSTTAGYIEDKATGNVRAVTRQYGKVLWIEPTHSASRKEAIAKAQAQLGEIAPEPVPSTAHETYFVHQGKSVTIAHDFKGTHGWRWYIDDHSTGRSIRSERAYLLPERAIFEAKLLIDEEAK